MAKQLSMGQISSILTLHQSGHSNRKIAKLLGIHRETVAKYVAREEAGQAVPAKPDHRVPPGPISG
jgi:transposase